MLFSLQYKAIHEQGCHWKCNIRQMTFEIECMMLR